MFSHAFDTFVLIPFTTDDILSEMLSQIPEKVLRMFPIMEEIVPEIEFQIRSIIERIALDTVSIWERIASQMFVNVVCRAVKSGSKKSFIPFQMVSTRFFINSSFSCILSLIAVQISEKKSRMLSKIGVIKSTIPFQIALIFSETQSITLPTTIWIASKIVSNKYPKALINGSNVV